MSLLPPSIHDTVIIGGGPAGLFAAERLAQAGRSVVLFDRMPSLGRKFLVAGTGGLNLTHAEELELFITRYSPAHLGPISWAELLADFPPSALQAWAKDLGVETFIGTSGRVFPTTKQAAPLLRRWLARLRQQGVIFHSRHTWIGLRPTAQGHLITFRTLEGDRVILASRLLLALGGASWPQTGSNAEWISILQPLGVTIAPFTAANCGYEVAWTEAMRAQAEGLPLKNIAVSAGLKTIAGELLITAYGLEGGALYQLGDVLRTQATPQITLDLKPSATVEQLRNKLGAHPFSLKQAKRSWRLSPAVHALLKHHAPSFSNSQELASFCKAFPLALQGPRPIAEAISSAGGVAGTELDSGLQLKRLPGVFCAGEMLDWTAPTGGYLLQGCFATAFRAAQALLA